MVDADTYANHARQGAFPKSLLLAPERLTLAMLEDGWLVRNKIVWQKANPMPGTTSQTFRGGLLLPYPAWSSR